MKRGGKPAWNLGGILLFLKLECLFGDNLYRVENDELGSKRSGGNALYYMYCTGERGFINRRSRALSPRCSPSIRSLKKRRFWQFETTYFFHLIKKLALTIIFRRSCFCSFIPFHSIPSMLILLVPLSERQYSREYVHRLYHPPHLSKRDL